MRLLQVNIVKALFKGDRGAPGERGQVGPRGPTGDKGPSGPSGVVGAPVRSLHFIISL